MNYLELCNQVARRLNEVVMTSANFASATGVHGHIKDAVNNAIRDINNAELEWPFNRTLYTQAITPGKATHTIPAHSSVDWESFFLLPTQLLANPDFTSNITGWTDNSSGTGTSAWTSTGNGRLRLNAGVAGTAGAYAGGATILGRTYRINFRAYGSINMIVDNSGGGTTYINETFSYTDGPTGQFYSRTFTTTSAIATNILFQHAGNANVDIDMVTLTEEVQPRKLLLVSENDYDMMFKADETNRLVEENLDEPYRVFRTQGHDEFGLSPIPMRDMSVQYNYWSVPDDLSAYTDEPTIYERFHPTIVDGATWYVYMFRDNAQQAQLMRSKFDTGINRMRRELIDRNHYFFGKSLFYKQNPYGLTR